MAEICVARNASNVQKSRGSGLVFFWNPPTATSSATSSLLRDTSTSCHQIGKKKSLREKKQPDFHGAVLKLPFHCCNSLAQFLLSLLVLLLLYPVFSKHKRLDRIEEFALKKQVFLTAANLLGKVSSMKLWQLPQHLHTSNPHFYHWKLGNTSKFRSHISERIYSICIVDSRVISDSADLSSSSWLIMAMAPHTYL